MTHTARLAAVALLVLLPGILSAAGARETVSVFDFRVSHPDLNPLAAQVAGGIRTAVARNYNVVPPSQVTEKMAELQAKLDAEGAGADERHPTTNTKLAYDLARGTGAEYVVSGILYRRSDGSVDMIGVYFAGGEQMMRRGIAYLGRDLGALSQQFPNMMREFDAAVAQFRQVRSSRAQRVREMLNNLPRIKEEIRSNQVIVPGGPMTMGADDLTRYEYPPHKVNISSFTMDRFEVSNYYYAAFLTETRPNDETLEKWIDLDNRRSGLLRNEQGYIAREGMEDLPVIFVSWEGAKAYANWMEFDLPSEAQWEYAAGNGNEHRPFAGHLELDIPVNVARATYNFYQSNPGPVDSFEPNPYGLYNMTGNVMEWCRDWLQPNYYEESDIQDPPGPVLEDTTSEDRKKLFTHHAVRGGAFNTMELHEIRTERRWWGSPTEKQYYIGFRCVRR